MTEDAPSKLVEQVDRHIREAMKARDQATLAPLRMLKAALLNRRVEKGQSLEDREFVQVVASLVKQRRDAIAQFTAGGRQDLADTEAAEITVLAAYLPPPPDPAEIDAAVQAAVAETGATSGRDIGKVMKAAMAKLAGRNVDGKTVNELVRKRLAGA